MKRFSRPLSVLPLMLVAAVVLSACSVLGVRSAYETHAYDVVERHGGDIEIRRYGPRLAVEAVVAAAPGEGQRAAFRLLFDYISGANRAAAAIAMTRPVETASTAIAMTAPVETARSGSETRMRFFLPASYDAASAPRPTDPRLSIVEVPAGTVAALRFSWFGGEDRIEAKTRELLARLQGMPWRPAAAPVANFYDPPWTLPFLRRNEVAVPVAR